MSDRKPVFLVAEDSESHLELIKFGFKKAGVVDGLRTVVDGEEALKYLKGEADFSERDVPDVIMLDLNMPKLNGLEVLQAIKQDENLKHIPVLILSTSNARRDREEAYERRANSYLIKPYDLKTLCEMMADVVRYWGGWNQTAILGGN